MKSLIGEYTHNIDSKRRVFIPSGLRVSKNWVVTMGFENCLFLFPEKEWESITEKIKASPLTKKDTRNFFRLFLSQARALQLDGQGRILIPESLGAHSGLKKSCVFVGMLNRVEIWEPGRWREFLQTREGSFTDMAENITGIDF